MSGRPIAYRLSIAACVVAFGAVGDAAEPVDYVRQVRPIFRTNCYRCHGPDKQKSELRLDTVKSMLAGGSLGPAIVPGKSGESLLVAALLGKSDDVVAMPPADEAPALADAQIALIKTWIDEGARHPADEKPEPPRPKPADHWAFRPIARPTPPVVGAAAWVRTPIDAFVLARLQKEGLAPSPEADPVTLIRRLSLDLVGLPPTPAEVAAFVADRRADAYERVVDRLLASPHYGERWGRHWLDQARYADSNGYTNDEPRVMWKYRDWVLDAINADTPLDQFTIEQLAGDLLPAATVSQVIATGFHRNTQFNSEGGSDPEQYRVEAVVDRVATTGSVFLGLTLGCARCHDHKYDPVSQEEFYRLFAFFNNQDEPIAEVPPAGHGDERWDALARTLTTTAKGAVVAPAKQDKKDKAKKPKPTSSKKDAAEQAPPNGTRSNPPKEPAGVSQPKQAAAAAAAPAAESAPQPNATTVLVLQERKQPRESYLHIRGEFLRKGKSVTPGVPAMLPPIAAAANPAGESTGKPPRPLDRLDLARWLVAPDHPLTSRVAVNRAWLHFFGRGLVDSDSDFGIQGTPPSHPELLDWLARELTAGGWSMKRLHRLIVTSATYRQASHARPELRGVDPTNRLLAQQNRVRLDAEVIRDAALEASGLLSHKLGGPSVFPPQPDGVMKMTRTPGRKWVISPGEDRYRRGLYTFFWRSTPHPFLKLFNAPESNTTCTRRDRSNTPLQALTLLNDEMFAEAARALARRTVAESPSASVESRMDLAFRLVVGRKPKPAEAQALCELVAAELAEAATPPSADSSAGVDRGQLDAWTTAARTLLNLDEFMTRE